MKQDCDTPMKSQYSQSMAGSPLRSFIDSQRAQAVYITPSESVMFPSEISSNVCESSYVAVCNEIETEMASHFQTVQADKTSQDHTLGKDLLYVNTPYVSVANSSTDYMPSWEMAESSRIGTVEAINMGQVQVHSGLSSFSHNIGVHMETGDEVSRQSLRDSAKSLSEGFQIQNVSQGLTQESLPVVPQETCILSRFQAIRDARNSYTCKGAQHVGSRRHVTEAGESQASRREDQQIYTSGGQLLGIASNAVEINDNTSVSSLRGSSKRKICAIGNSASDSSSKVSAYTSAYSGTSDPELHEALDNGRHFSNGSMISFFNSTFGNFNESMVTSVEGSNLQHGERSSMDVLNIGIDESHRSKPLGLILGQHERTVAAENAGVGTETSGVAAHRAISENPSQVRWGAIRAQPDLRLSRRMQYEPSTTSLQMNSDFSTFLTSSAVFSGSPDRVNSANFSPRRESISARRSESRFESHVPGDRFCRNSISSLRGRRIRFPSSSSYEVVQPEAMNEGDSVYHGAFEFLNPADLSMHAIPLTNRSSSHGFSEYDPVRSQSHMPTSDHRHHTGLASMIPSSVLSSATSEPSATSGNSGIPTASDRPSSSSRVFRRLMLSRQSLLDVFGERLPFSVSGSFIGLPSQRLGAAGNPEEQHHRVLDSEINEMLMLEATILFGGIGLQDRHSDWRLDVDNMSYEELLALEERMGDVCTGVDEELIAQKLTMSKFAVDYQKATNMLQETDMKCSICQEEYEEGVEVAALACGHSYHSACIKQWLALKNLCPVCKVTAIS